MSNQIKKEDIFPQEIMEANTKLLMLASEFLLCREKLKTPEDIAFYENVISLLADHTV